MDAAEASVPRGWCRASIRDVCDLNPGKPASGEVAADTPVAFVPMPAVDADAGAIAKPQVRAFGEVRKGFTAFRDNDVIVAKITPCFENGKAAVCRGLLNGLGFGSTEFHVLRSTGAVLPEYVYHFVRQESVRRDGEANMTGSVGQKRVPAEWLASLVIPVPPLAEQRRIVAKVEEVLARVNAARERLAKLPALLKRFRQSVLAAACSGRLTADWREEHRSESVPEYLEHVRCRREAAWTSRSPTRRCPPSTPFDPENLPDVPDTWRWSSADSLCAQITDGEHIQPKYRPTGRPMLTATHVRDGYVVMDDCGFIAEDDFERCLARCAPTENDVLIVSVGATTGRSAIVRGHPPFAIVRSVLLLRPLIEPEYLLRWTQSPWCFRWMTEASGASAQPHLYISDTKRMPIPVPPPDEQVEIARRVRGFLALAEKIEKRISAARIRVDKAVQATLAKAFRGELVPTEAGLAQREGREFESADQLLELIRAARQAASAPTARARPRHAVAASGAESFPDGLFTETPPPSPERPPDTADIPRPVPASCEGSPTPQADAKRADMSYDEAMGCVRAAFEEGGPRDREQAIHDVAAALGFQRVGSRVREDIDGYLRAAVRRGILGNDGGTYSLLARSAADYTRDHLIDMLLASVDGSWTDREEATRCTARHLGFRKAGSAFKAAMRSAINGAIRRGLLEYEGELIRKRAAGG